MMKCILHIGIEKTGTTSLQEFFYLNKALLSQNGYHYLESPGLKNHRKLPALFYEDNLVDNFRKSNKLVDSEQFTKWKTSFKEELVSEIKGVGENIHTIIISSEHFQSRLATPKSIRNLSIFLRQYFNQIDIYVYLRRQDRLATSLYSTALKSGKVNHVIFPKVNPKSHYFNYNVLLKKWIKHFKREEIHCRIYEKNKLKQNDIVCDFLEFTEIKLSSEPVLPESKNEKLDIQTMLILEAINSRFSKKKIVPKTKLLKLRLDLVKALQSLDNQDKQYFHPQKKEALKFYRQFKKSNLNLSKNWFDSDTIIFDDDFSFYSDNENQNAFITIEQVDILLDQLTPLMSK